MEAELGKLAGVEEHVSSAEHVYTDPDQAVDFVQRTGCDSLAVAIGTSHGAYKFKGEAKLDFPRLEAISARLPGYPLVLHGASSVPQEFVELCNKYGGQVGGARGVPEDMLRKAAGMGVCKIDHRGFFLGGGPHDALDDFHIVDVERAHGVAPGVGGGEHFSGTHKRHGFLLFCLRYGPGKHGPRPDS